MDESSNSNIKTGECIIYIQHDFQIEDFKKWFEHILNVDKQVLSCRLIFKDIWLGYSDEVLKAEGTSREEVNEIFDSIDKCLINISSLQIESCKYIDNGNVLKLYIVYRCDIDFGNVVTYLSERIDLIYKKHLYDMKQQNNLKFKEERI